MGGCGTGKRWPSQRNALSDVRLEGEQRLRAVLRGSTNAHHFDYRCDRHLCPLALGQGARWLGVPSKCPSVGAVRTGAAQIVHRIARPSKTTYADP